MKVWRRRNTRQAAPDPAAPVTPDSAAPIAPDPAAPVYSQDELMRALFRVLLLREPTDANFPDYLLERRGRSIDSIMKELLGSEEFVSKHQMFLDQYLPSGHYGTSDLDYRCPADLSIAPAPPKRVLLVGQCLLGDWPNILKEMLPGCECDFFMFNQVQALPEEPPAPVSDYDFQVVGIPLRSVLPEPAYFRLSYADAAGYQRLFDGSVERMRQFLAAAMRWNAERGLLTFVANFILPQQNLLGRLMPRHELQNMVYFVEQLNAVLDEEIRRYSNAHYFDFDQVIATYGRRYFQDDAVWIANHNANLSDFDFEFDAGRIEPPVKASSVYPVKARLFERLAWIEILSMYRTIRQLDMVKLVVVDIDDTVWRGVAVEHGAERVGEVVEGWPLGFVEALSNLKRRGILLAVLSKNEESLVAPIWQRIYGDSFPLEEFAIRKINWKPKAENFEEILKETNLLPRSVVYIDDNPVERAAIKSAFPDVRVMGPNPLVWRRILLWAAETQVSAITAESTSRTEMVRAQVERETQRKMLSREEFLASLDTRVWLREIDGVSHPDFPRALELLNKTNQFNTTGQRWTNHACAAAIADGSRFFVFEARDKFSSYGVVGVVICTGVCIAQFVMSCRVVGMEIEIAVVSKLMEILRREGKLHGELKRTELNLATVDLWRNCGFDWAPHVGWTRPFDSPLAPPAHIRIAMGGQG